MGLFPVPLEHTFSYLSTEQRARAARFCRLLVVYARQAAAAMPVAGPLAGGGLEVVPRLAGDTDRQRLRQRLGELVAGGGGLGGDARQLQDDVDVLAALAMLVWSRQAELLAWLHANQESAAAEELTGFAMDAALAAYRARVALRYRDVDLRGRRGGGRASQVTALPLDAVYLPPQLLPERARSARRDAHERALRRRLEDPDLDPATRARLEDEDAVLAWLHRRAVLADLAVGPVGLTLARDRRAVILGDPGVGKTALVRYLARTCALGEQPRRLGWDEPLTPVVLPLTAFTTGRSNDPALSIREFLDTQAARQGGAVLQSALAREADAGRALVLLDGLDEVPEHAERLHVVRAVDRFLLELGTGDQASRCLVTARPDRYIRLAGPIPHFQLPSFTPRDVRWFVRGWQEAVERGRHPDAPDLQRAHADARALLSELDRNAKVAELATNPLMLVVVSLLRDEEARLPAERVRLDDLAVLMLLDTRNRGPSLPEQDAGEVGLPVDRLLRVWARMAAWTRQEKPAGVVHRAQLERRLAHVLRDEGLDEKQADATAVRCLHAAADRGGLLEERGPEAVAFWHPALEEFLAAVELMTPTSRAIRRLLPLRADPRWREVILLAVGHAAVVRRDPETAGEMVTAIADQDPSPLEPVLHTNLLLAAACVAEDIGVSDSVAEHVVTRLATLLATFPYEPIQDAFVHTVRGLPRLRPRQPDTVSALVAVTAGQPWEVRMEAARWLGNIAAENPTARGACEQLLTDPNEEVRRHAAFGLVRAGDDRRATWTALLARLGSGHAYLTPVVGEFLATSATAARTVRTLLTDPEPNLRSMVAEALAEVGALSDPDTLTAVRALLTDPEPNVRDTAVQALATAGKLSDPDPDTLVAVRALLADPERLVRDSAVLTLAQAGLLSDPDASAVVRALLTDPHYDLHDLWGRLARALRIAETLRDPDTHAAVRALLTDPRPFVRYKAVWSLQFAGLLRDPDTHTAVRALLTDPHPDVRESAVRVLAGPGLLSDPDTHAAVRALLSDPEPNVRSGLAEVLAGPELLSDPGTLTAVRALLTDPERLVRREAVQALAKAGKLTDPGTLTAVRALLTDPDSDVRSWVAWELAEAGALRDPGTLTAVRALLTDPDHCVREMVARALQMAGVLSDPGTLTAVRALLTDPEPLVRRRVAWALAEAGALRDPGTLTAVRALLTDPEPFVRRDAVQALAKAGRFSDPDTLPAVAALLTDPEPDVRRALVTDPEPAWRHDAVQATQKTSVLRDPDTLAAVRALVGDPDALAAVRGLLSDPEPDVRRDAVQALQMAGALSDPDTHAAVRALLTDPEPKVRRDAAWALLRPGGSPLAALEDLTRLASDTPGVALAACERIVAGHELTLGDGRELAKLVRHRSGEPGHRNDARRAIFEWLWSINQLRRVAIEAAPA